MKLSSTDIPQAPRLTRVRAVVEAVAEGKQMARGVAERVEMSPRDAGYHLIAATRALGLLLTDARGRYGLTKLGKKLAATEAGSEEEREAFAAAVRDSSVLRAWAGDLLGKRGPALVTLVRRAKDTGLSEKTARQRSKGVLTWREQLLVPPKLRYGAPAPRALHVGEAGAERQDVTRSMLTSLHLIDFKSFASESFPLAPLTVFVGANASGKSNALDAIRLLQGVALEQSISDVIGGRHEGGRLVWPMIRGGIAEVARSRSNAFAVHSEWTIDGQAISHHLGCTTEPVPLVTEERLSGAGLGQYLFDTHAPTLGQRAGLQEGRAINVGLQGVGGGKNPAQCHSAAASLLGQIEPRGRVNPRVIMWAQRLQQAMRGATFLNITPSAMREWAPRQALEMGADGENISAVVHRLCESEDGKRRLVDWLSELCAPRIHDIEFARSDLGDVMLQLVEAEGTRVSARSLSDGTLRFLGELVAVLTAERGSILLVEEIENGLHPQRLHLLVELLEAVTSERGIQVIATTHSPLVLLALSRRARSDAIVFARVAEAEGTVARRLGDLPHFDEVSSRRGIDRLFASGWLERAL